MYDGAPSYFQDSNIVWLQPSTSIKYDKQYLFISLSMLEWHELGASTIKRIYSSDLLKKYWKVPSLREQQKIAAYFTTLDRSIAAAQKKAAALRTIKKGLLQKMFI